MTNPTKPPNPLPETLPAGTRFTCVPGHPMVLEEAHAHGGIPGLWSGACKDEATRAEYSESRIDETQVDWSHHATLVAQQREQSFPKTRADCSQFLSPPIPQREQERPIQVGDWVEFTKAAGFGSNAIAVGDRFLVVAISVHWGFRWVALMGRGGDWDLTRCKRVDGPHPEAKTLQVCDHIFSSRTSPESCIYCYKQREVCFEEQPPASSAAKAPAETARQLNTAAAPSVSSSVAPAVPDTGLLREMPMAKEVRLSCAEGGDCCACVYCQRRNDSVPRVETISMKLRDERSGATARLLAGLAGERVRVQATAESRSLSLPHPWSNLEEP